MKRLFITAFLLVLTVLFGITESVEAKENGNNLERNSKETKNMDVTMMNQVGALVITSEGVLLNPNVFQSGEFSEISLLPKLISTKNINKKIIKVSNAKSSKKYYVTNPKQIISKKKLKVYKKKDFTTKNYKQTYAAGTVLKVKKITKSTAGVPHLELSNGYFVSAHKNNVLKISAAAAKETFYTSTDKVKQIMTLKDLKTYRSATATTKGTSIPKYTVFNVNKVTYTGSGKNRFQLKNGQFISASKNDVVEVPETIENYYREARTDIQTQREVYSYDNLMFGETNNKKLLSIGTNVQVVDVVYNRLGYPRFELSNGEYVSTKKTLYKQIPWYEQ